jgi:aryl-alcohol dehydrogenase-like predicted oxidoreductase
MGREADEVVAWCEANAVPFFAYSPLRSSIPAPRLAAVAAARGVSLQRLQLAALLHSSPVVSVISGATRPQTTLDSVAAEREPWDAELQTAYEQDLA